MKWVKVQTHFAVCKLMRFCRGTKCCFFWWRKRLSFPCFFLLHFHLEQGQRLKLRTIVKYVSLLCGELKPWHHKTFQSATFPFLSHFPKFQKRALIAGCGLAQHVPKSPNTTVFMVPAMLLQLLLNCSENVNSLCQFTVRSWRFRGFYVCSMKWH